MGGGGGAISMLNICEAGFKGLYSGVYEQVLEVGYTDTNSLGGGID